MPDSPLIRRCAWAGNDPQMQKYHDEEWGVPQHDSRMLWEMLMLEGFQAGLAWIIVLRKRDEFRKAFAGFDPRKVAKFKERDITRLMGNAGIIRARAKMHSGMGAKQHLESALVTRARRMLLYTEESAARIASALGFADPSYFSRFFRRNTGLSPSAFRSTTGVS